MVDSLVLSREREASLFGRNAGRYLGVIEAKAIYDGGTEEVYVRIAPRGSSVYLDLGDASWRSVEIRPDGWNIVDTAPVRFRRPPGLRPLPAPAQGGTIDRLKDFAQAR